MVQHLKRCLFKERRRGCRSGTASALEARYLVHAGPLPAHTPAAAAEHSGAAVFGSFWQLNELNCSRMMVAYVMIGVADELPVHYRGGVEKF